MAKQLINISLDPGIKAKGQAMAKANLRSFSSWIEALIQQAVVEAQQPTPGQSKPLEMRQRQLEHA
jgi:hypothetical protein